MTPRAVGAWALALAVAFGVTAGASGAVFRETDPELPAFSLPFAFGVGPDGSVAVLEDLAGRVVTARPGGDARVLPGLARPAAVAVDPGGTVLVLDREAGGWVLRVWRGGRERAAPLGGDVAPREPVDMDARDGIAWVLDRSPPRVLLYAYDGASLGWTDLAARAPFSVALGGHGEAFVTDPAGPGVLSFSPSGAPLGPVSLEGTGVTRPTGVAVDPGGTVWVSDGVTGRVVGLEPSGAREVLRSPDGDLRLDDPLRLRWREGLFVLQGRPGRVRRMEVQRR